MNANAIAESIFDSIDRIVEKRIANLEYDKTVVCTITDASEAVQKNIYTATDGNARFKVQGNGSTYSVGDQVRVVIPKGNYNEQKFIQGKYSADDTAKPITYVSPLGSVLKITDNLFSAEEGAASVRGVAANREKFSWPAGPATEEEAQKLKPISISSSQPKSEISLGRIVFSEETKNKNLYDTIYLSAEFQTAFDAYNMVKGDYGLHIIIALEKPKANDPTQKENDRIDLYFSANDNMYGNPYSFKIFTEQEIKYKFSDYLDQAVGAEVRLYQDNNFIYLDSLGQEIIYQPSYTDKVVKENTGEAYKKEYTIFSDIKVKNIVFGFGSEVTNVDDINIKLYTNDNTNYRSNDAVVDNKNLKLLWYNKSENNEYIGFSDGKWSYESQMKDNPTSTDTTQYYYDEEEYRTAAAKNSRLLARRSEIYPADELSLTLAADAHDIKLASESLFKLIGSDLYQIIQGFYKWTLGIAWGDSGSPFITLLGTNEGSLSKYASDIRTYGTAVFNLYDTILKWAKDPTTASRPQAISTTDNAFLNLLKLISGEAGGSGEKGVIANCDALYTTFFNLLTAYPTYKNIYDTYKARWDQIKIKIQSYVTQINGWNTKQTAQGEPTTNIALLNEIRGTPEADFNTLTSKTAYIDLTTKDDFKAKWDNKYCIYWYRYDADYMLEDTFMPAHWERMTALTNRGLPDKQKDAEYLDYKSNDTIEVSLRQEREAKQEEKFAVVLFYNHQQFTSNEVVFTNLYQVPDRTAIDANGALSIEHYNEASQDSYQLYGSNGVLINAADAQTKRQLRARFNGETGKDEQLVGANIYWYIPSSATMIEVVDREMKDLGFSSDRVVYYKNIEEYNNAEESGRLSTLTVNVVGPDVDESGNTVYKFYHFTDKYKTHKQSTGSIIYHDSKKTSSSFADTTKIYLVKKQDDPYKYDVWEYDENNIWSKVETIDKYNSASDAHAPICSSTSILPSDESVEDGDTYLVGPNTSDNNSYTYYTYDSTQTLWVNTNQKIYNLTLALFGTLDYKPGYYCYYKTIGFKTGEDQQALKDENDNYIVLEADTVFPYHIKTYYQQTATQNSILCVVKKNDYTYQTAKYFTFSSYGNNGTDYTLALTPNAQYPMVTDDNPLFINTTLYDYESNEIPIKHEATKVEGQEVSENDNLISKIKYEWVGPHSGYESPVTNHSNNELIGCTVYRKQESNNNKYSGILRCSIKDVYIESLKKKIKLQTDIAIPYCVNQGCYIEGTSSVLYDSSGGNPQYYKKPYKLYNTFDNKEIEGITWRIEYYKGSEIFSINDTTKTIIINGGAAQNITNTIIDEYSLNYLPRLNSDNILVPSAMYLSYTNSNSAVYPVVIAEKTDTQGQGGPSITTVYWAQPILITQDKHSSTVINEWDGSLKVDDENGTILSTMVGAGRKNNENKFEGVLMGDVATGSEDNTIVTSGVYGFHNSEQSFAFKVDGTAFLGKSGGGRIYMDGNNAFLYSQSWITSDKYNDSGNKITNIDSTTGADLTHTLEGSFYNDADGIKTPYRGSAGMLIDLKNGYIDAYNFKLTSNLFTLSNSHIAPLSSGAMRTWYNTIGNAVSEEKGKIIFKAGDDNFAITEKGYFFAKAGKIANWKIETNSLTTDASLGTSNSFHMYANGSGSGEIIGNTLSNWSLGIGEYFGVTSEGHIYAARGQIATWTLADKYLKSTHAGMGSQKDGGSYAFWAGSQKGNGTTTPFGTDAPFRVDYDGKVIATRCEIGPLTVEPSYVQVFTTLSLPETKTYSASGTKTRLFMVQLEGITLEENEYHFLDFDYYCRGLNDYDVNDHMHPITRVTDGKYYYDDYNVSGKPKETSVADKVPYCDFIVNINKPNTPLSFSFTASDTCKGVLIYETTRETDMAGFQKSARERWRSQYKAGGTYTFKGTSYSQIYIRLLGVGGSSVSNFKVTQEKDILTCKIVEAGIYGRFGGDPNKYYTSDWSTCKHWLGLNELGEIIAYEVK